MKLVVGTDSTWSLRALICAELVNIKFDVEVINLTADNYKRQILTYSPTGLVPALIHDELVLHDSLAIVEYFNEYADGLLYPQAVNERALARSLCSEMHSGFSQIRTVCPFTLDEVTPLTTYSSEMTAELERISEIFASAQLPFMFERSGIVDAFYAILAFRLQTYGVELAGKAGEYQQSLLNWPLLQYAIKQAQRWRKV
ncbi:glutathione S-transferase [Thalassotalea insulae]|uniref:Glutathione S-transferase n=1 Tax=Thalassotalea insulae TaxID=2056778 RepID=A0ABQ6GZZ2_9GAMM|nr:glutathione S-transferase [Thalassotalea insulae]GLX80191.1 glutathione S-transferase [Thalassotalea insulae]